MDKLYIVMPAYNEAANIRNVVAEWYPLLELGTDDSRLLAVNDGSRDNTAEICRQLMTEYPRFVMLDQTNAGHGPACLHAYRTAISEGADYIFQTDSDGQTRPDEFGLLWENRDKFDLNIGYRHRREDGSSRVAVSRVLRALLRLRLGVSVKDANTPFRLMPAAKLAEWMECIPGDFFLANAALSAAAVYSGSRICWHPISFRPRQGGVNSINMKRTFRIGLAAFSDFGRIRSKLKERYGRPRKAAQTVIPPSL